MSDIIKIDINVFKEYYKSMNKQITPCTLLKKKNEIYNNFKCFHINHETHLYTPEKKLFYKRFKENQIYTKPQATQRLYIISSNFTEEDKTKKLFTSYLNKLTIQNKNVLYSKIESLLKTDYKEQLYNIIWDFIKKSSNSILYVDLLKFYDSKKIEDNWILYIKEKKWYPYSLIDKSNLLSSDEKVYDEYCEYVKYKKEISNIINAWCLYNNNLNYIDNILNDLYEFFDIYKDNKDKKHLIDFTLEQIYNIMKKYRRSFIQDKFSNIHLDTYDSSTRFLILNILELK